VGMSTICPARPMLLVDGFSMVFLLVGLTALPLTCAGWPPKR